MAELDSTTMNRAKEFVASLTTDNETDFDKALSAQALRLWGFDDGVDWWNASAAQRGELMKLVPAGTKQAACKDVLFDHCTQMSQENLLVALRTFTPSEFDRAGWFQYFFTEAKRVAAEDAASAALVNDIALTFFGNRVRSKPKGFYQKTRLDDADESMLKQLLYVLLTIGFERIPATKQQAFAGDTSNALVMGKMRWAGEALTGKDAPAISVLPVEFKWRCDSRSFAEVKAANGFTTKSNSEDYARSKGLRDPWHPFSDEGTRSYMWFRKGQGDNCLYNVVSVGTKADEWKAYLPYPKIDLSGGSVTKLRGYLGKKPIKCLDLSSNKTVTLELPASETYLFMFVLAGLVFDTGAMQGKDSYPEVAVGNIPLKNVYGAVRFVRYHLGDEATVTDHDGVIAVLDRSGTVRCDDDGVSIKASAGEKLFGIMKTAFDSVERTDKLRVKWMGTGAGYMETQPSQPFTYSGKEYRFLGV